MKKNTGFTLAEVLITLVIIGIIAALTIPAIISNMNEKATVTKLKKAYTTLRNATLAAVAENGPIDTWGFGDNIGDNSVIFNEKIKPYLNISKDCKTGTGCWNETATKRLNGTTWNNMNTSVEDAKMILADGMFITSWLQNPACNNNVATGTTGSPLNERCGNIEIDIDGYKGENTSAKDIFMFYITKNGQIIPTGTPEETSYPINTTCKMSAQGYGCAAWVIYKENMDYLRKTIAW